MHRQGYDLQLTQYDERGWRRDVLHELDGALANRRDGHRLGADAVARDAAGGVGCVEESKLAFVLPTKEGERLGIT